MGTRSIVNVVGEYGQGPLVSIYSQFDGYPSGMGDNIKKILNHGNVTLLNGFNGHSCPSHFNGMGCLAAYLVGELKDGKIGNVYLYPIGSIQGYDYTLYPVESALHMKCLAHGKVFFDGPLSDFDGRAIERAEEE